MKRFKKISMFAIAFSILFSCVAPITNVFATSYGEGEKVKINTLINNKL